MRGRIGADRPFIARPAVHTGQLPGVRGEPCTFGLSRHEDPSSYCRPALTARDDPEGATARSILTATVPADDDTTRKLISLPMCPFGDGPVSRFITVGTDTYLGCDLCFRTRHTEPEVIHSSYAVCKHDSTPSDRAKCRTARRKGEVYAGEGYGDDVLVPVIRVNGSKVHGAAEDGTPVCTGEADQV